jgi:hypothetical protein
MFALTVDQASQVPGKKLVAVLGRRRERLTSPAAGLDGAIVLVCVEGKPPAEARVRKALPVVGGWEPRSYLLLEGVTAAEVPIGARVTSTG